MLIRHEQSLTRCWKWYADLGVAFTPPESNGMGPVCRYAQSRDQHPLSLCKLIFGENWDG